MHRQREFRAYMKAANQTPGRRDSRHLSEAEMIAYCRGEMPATKREAAQAHLVACESCVALFRDVSDFLEPARAGEQEIGAAEINEAWPALWARVQTETPPVARTNVVRADAPGLRAWKFFFDWRAAWWRPALTFAALALVAASLFYLFSSKPKDKSRETARHESPTPAPGTSPVNQAPVLAQDGSPTPSPNPRQQPTTPPANEEVLAMDIKARPGDKFENSATRGEREEVARASLLTARKLYLDASGDERLRKLLGDQLTQSLSVSSRFALTGNRDEAEIALIVIVESILPAQDKAMPDRKISFAARVVGADGKTLWPVAPHILERRYQGQAAKAAGQMTQDLLGDIQRLERKRQ